MGSISLRESLSQQKVLDITLEKVVNTYLQVKEDDIVKQGGSSVRKLLVITLVGALLCLTFPGTALAWGCCYGGHWHGGWWLPGAIVGGLLVGAAAIVTAPFWALSAVAGPAYPPPVTYAPPVAYAPPPAYSAAPMYAPPPTYASPPPTYQPVPGYAPTQVAPVQRQVVYPNGRYVLYGDGVSRPWQWVWVPSASPPPPPAPPAP